MNQQDNLFRIPRHIQTRWASAENWRGEKGAACKGENIDPVIAAAERRGYVGTPDLADGRKRSAQFVLRPGSSKTLAEAQGTSGMIRRIWMTIGNQSPEWLRGIRLDIYWDGAATPAVSAPLGDFFGHGLGRMTTFENALFSSPEGRSFVCIAPMPFQTGMKVVITNELSENPAAPVAVTAAQCYFDVDYTLGDLHEADMGYFHAHWRRERPTTLGRDFEFLPRVTGRGRFLGVNVSVIPNTATNQRMWWGEGEVKFYLDGDTTHPTLCGTGTEDYIGTAWGLGRYANLYQGCLLADFEDYRFSFYRLHIPDPVYFQSDLRVTMQMLGCLGPQENQDMLKAGRQFTLGGQQIDHRAKYKDFEEGVPFGGFSLLERQDDLSSCAWFYLDRPENGLPALAPVADRIVGVGLNFCLSDRHSPFISDGWAASALMPAGDITAAPYLPSVDDGPWTPVPPGPGRGSGNAHFVNVNELRGPDGMVYLARKVKVAEAGDWILHVGHDGGARVFVDGKPVGASAGAINPAPYTRTAARLDLAAGEHEIVVALDRAGGKGWGIFVSFEIPEKSGVTTRKLTFPEPK